MRLDQTVIDALTRLNSWVRSPSRARWGAPGVGPAIYHYKGRVLEELARADCLGVRLVEVQVRCRDCGGTGRYVDRNGYGHDHCRACDSTGTARLAFAETTMPGGAVWHTPLSWRMPSALRELVAGRVREPAGEGWTTQQPGQDLTPVELAQCLNAVEFHLYGARHPQHDPRYDGWDIGECPGPDPEPWLYRLPIGERMQACGYCAAELPEGALGCQVSDRHFTWTAGICAACEKQIMWFHKTGGFLSPLPVPAELAQPLPVQIWRARRDPDVSATIRIDWGFPQSQETLS